MTPRSFFPTVPALLLMLAALAAAPDATHAQQPLRLAAARPAAAQLQAGRGAWLARYEGRYVLPTGARLAVRVAGRSLAVAAEGQEAVEALDLSGAAGARLNLQAATVLAAFVRNDLDAVAAVCADAARGRRDLGALADALADAYGPATGFDIQGTVPQPNDRMATFARVTFARGTVDLRLLWTDGQLATIHPRPAPAMTRQAVPVSRTEFVVLDSLDETPHWLRFDEGGGALVIDHDGSRIEAHRLAR